MFGNGHGPGDPRIRILALFLINWAHGVSQGLEIILVAAITVFTIALYWQAFVRYAPIVGFTIAALCLLSILAWITTNSLALTNVGLNLLRWTSLSVFSLTIFSSLNALEFIVALQWYKIPRRIALALGISLRFSPVVYEEAKRILLAYRVRSVHLQERGKIRWYVKLIEWFVPILFVSMVRQIENITITVIIQDIEGRLAQYKFQPLTLRDAMLFAIFIPIPLSVIVFRLVCDFVTN